MLANLRPFHNTEAVTNMVSKFPQWMSIRKEDSVGQRVLNSLTGIELETLDRNIDIYSRFTNIVDSPTDSISNLWNIQVEYPILSGNIKPLDLNGVSLPYNIELTHDNLSFFSNPITRLESVQIIHPSGSDGGPISSGIAGIEWFNGEPSGFLTIQQDIDPVSPSSIMYYKIRNRDNNINTLPYSGNNAWAVGSIGIDNAGYEILKPEGSGSLANKYPVNTWVTFDSSGNISSSNTPPSGTDSYNLFYNDVYSSYIDPSTKEKVYFYTAFNNPYGSGQYTQSDVILDNEVLSDLVVKDIMNLDPSGNPYIIDASGKALYYYSANTGDGVWEYIGYEEAIPDAWIPKSLQSGTIISGTFMFYTSYELISSSGYIDDEIHPHSGTFDWVDGNGPSGTVIRFTNPMSKYQAEYKYRVVSEPGSLSSGPKDTYNSVTNSDGQLYYMDGSDNNAILPTEKSKSNHLNYRTDCLNLRPCNDVDITLVINRRVENAWLNASGVDKTIQFTNHNVGFSDEFGA